MSTSLEMKPAEISTPIDLTSARRLLRSSLATDVDFEAFCTDCFQQVQRVYFSSGMERIQKENLLLQHISTDEIQATLECWLGKLSLQAATGFERVQAEKQQGLSKRLLALYDLKEQASLHGQDISELEAEVLKIRREQRQGPQLLPGEILARRFVLDRLIGQGGFATVWRAYDRRMRHMVAVKVLHGQWSADASRIERFYRGARRMAELQHCAIVQVVASLQQDEGFHFFGMEYLPGGDLRRRVLQDDLSRSQAIKALLQVGEALEFAHERRIVHRDVKPSNILLDEKLDARLTDFDLVHVPDSTGGTRTSAMGSVFYAAPEAMEDAKQVENPSADIYSLGMTLAFVIYGRDLPQRAWTDRKGFLLSLECSRALRSVIRRATEPVPSHRFSSAADFCTSLAEANGAPSSSPRSFSLIMGIDSRRPVDTVRWRSYLILGLLVLSFVGLVVGLWLQRYRNAPAVVAAATKGPQTFRAPLPVSHEPPAQQSSPEPSNQQTEANASPMERTPPSVAEGNHKSQVKVLKKRPPRKAAADVEIPIVDVM